MSPHYQGRALQTEARAARRAGPGRAGRVLRVLAALALATALAHLPWREIAQRVATVREVKVEGVRYLEPARVAAAAGVHAGQSLFEVDCARARQALLLQARIRSAEVVRRWPRGVTLRVAEREPVLVVRHGVAWEMDSAGVLLAPLSAGAVADVPLLTGVSFESLPEGARVSEPRVGRGLAWSRALAAGQLDLVGQVSEIDVGAGDATGLLLMNGARVIATPWPPGIRELSALRVVLADLQRRGTTARELDLRYQGQVIVRPAENAAAPDSSRHSMGA